MALRFYCCSGQNKKKRVFYVSRNDPVISPARIKLLDNRRLLRGGSC